MANLESALNDPEIRAEAAEALRSLIEKVVLTPDAPSPDGLSALLHGELATILALASAPTKDAAVTIPTMAQNAKSRGEHVFSTAQLSVGCGDRKPPRVGADDGPLLIELYACSGKSFLASPIRADRTVARVVQRHPRLPPDDMGSGPRRPVWPLLGMFFWWAEYGPFLCLGLMLPSRRAQARSSMAAGPARKPPPPRSLPCEFRARGSSGAHCLSLDCPVTWVSCPGR